jgi:uncharacterized phage protein gp47/JayE
MATFRSFSEIVSTMLQRLGFSQPNLDTKPGSVPRDLFVDLPADELARLYSVLNLVSDKQSLGNAVGKDLERLAANFGVTKNTGSAASGILIYATNSLASDIPIPNGSIGTSRSGIGFRTVGNYVMSSADKNRLAANATRLRKSLNIAGLNSTYAIEVPIRAVRVGSAGNVGSLQIVNSDLQGVASVVNLTSTTGGTNQESDDSFRARILAIFSGANIGTSAGYRNSVLGVTGVLDALVVEPGNSLMLRDGTETIELDDGTSRILNSGTGGKVDLYILGRKVEAVSESYIFTDLSGSGDIADERNDFILGQSNQDLTRTSEERRVQAFKLGILPAQPADSMIAVVGSSSGTLTESFLDENGVKQGSFELQKDLNPETGGSPFGFDKIHFISSKKEVEAEALAKGDLYGLDSLEFSDISSLDGVYVDLNELSENSEVSIAGSEFLQLRQTPVVRVSRVQNKTTGEVYSVVNQNLDSDNLNRTGVVKISGRSLPRSSDTLSVNYTWRKFFDKHIDFSGGNSFQFKIPSVVDVVDWSQSGGISEEKTVIEKTDDGLNFQVTLDYNASKVISVFVKTIATATVAIVDQTGAIGVVLSGSDESVSSSESIISIKRDADLLEVYKTEEDDGSFSSRVIYFPSDSAAVIGDAVTVHYNKGEGFDIKDSDGSIFNNIVVLPSEGVLRENDIFDSIEEIFFAQEDIYVKYVIDTNVVYPKISLSNLPITSIDLSNKLISLNGDGSSSSNQPVFYDYSVSSSPIPIYRFGPTPVAVEVSGVTGAGKIKVAGTTLNRYSLDITAGVSISGQIFDLQNEIKTALGLSSLPSNIGIAKVDAVTLLSSNGDEESAFDILGIRLNDSSFSVGTASTDSSLDNYTFVIPSTPNNSSIVLFAGDLVRIEFLLYNTDGAEEIFFSGSSKKSTKNRFGLIERVSVSSGFRSSTGNLIGSIKLDADSQPNSGDTYSVDYNFLAPKEGERLSISYNVNKLIIDSTLEVERVRPVTADVLVKEAEDILVDVQGTLLINDNSLTNTDKIVENVINSVSNALNTSVLGGTVDYSDIIATAAAVDGVDSVNISIFNETEKTGRTPFIKALDNQFISPGEILFEAVSRNKFRIN